jgi:hypothetical protein
MASTLHQTFWGKQQAPYATNRWVGELLLNLVNPTSAVRQHVVVKKKNDIATSASCTNIALL